MNFKLFLHNYHVCMIVVLLCSCGTESNEPPKDSDSGETGGTNDKIEYPVAEPIDMGLSVSWASWNMGENSEFGTNECFGWGDIGFGGDSLDDFPCPFPPENISGTEYDIATQRWGDGWRLPRDSEFSELWYNSDISIGEYNGTLYYKFTSKINGNTIYLPLNESVYYWCCYWTGDLYNKDTRKAIARHFDESASTPDFAWSYLERDTKICVRPVYEHAKVETSEAKDIKAKIATLCGSLSWLASRDAEEVGFYISELLSDIENPSQQTRKIDATIKDRSISAKAEGLDKDKSYYFRAYVVIAGKEYLGDTKEFTTLNAYEIGELYPNEINPIGVVFDVNTTGESGKIVSLDQTTLQWQPGIPTYVSANNRDDGSKNKFPINSPIPSWIQAHGSEWYCPAKNELHALCSAAAKVNKSLRLLGKREIENFYWASTQYSAEYYDLAWIVNVTENDTYMGYYAGWSSYNSKSQNRGVLAVKKF